jgi:large subunit ribosomal protein L9
MKVILLSDQRHLGRRGQEVAVKPGFARNYLMPRQLAVPATSANRAWFEQQKKKIDAEHAKERDAALEVAAKLTSLKLKIAKRVGATETLYGSVTSGDIVGLLKAQGIEIDKRRIELPHGLKTLGEHVVPIDLHSDITAELTVQIVSADAG